MSEPPPEDDLPPEGADYLWDRSGTPLPDVVRLEAVLAPLRHQAPFNEAGSPDVGPLDAKPVTPVRPRRVWMTSGVLAAAAAALLALWFAAGRDRFKPSARVPGLVCADAAEQPSWRVASNAGSTCPNARLPVGEWLLTGAFQFDVDVAHIGQLRVEPDSRLRILATGEREHRLELAQGVVHADVTAAPRLFVVETPAARAVDLGCAYTLTVGPDGGGELVVERGFVQLERDDYEAFVPAGYACEIDRARGPSVPYAVAANPLLRQALARADTTRGGPWLGTVLRHAGAGDTLTLWHLLKRLPPADRVSVYRRLHTLAPAPDTVTEDSIQAGDRAALETWRNDLEPLWYQDMPTWGPKR